MHTSKEMEKMNSKPKVLAFSDVPSGNSGVANMFRAIILGSKDKIDWVVLGGGSNDPNQAGKKVKWEDINVYYADHGYGSQFQIKSIIDIEQPDVLFFFTDPRRFEAHFRMEADLRKKYPFVFYTIWDNYPLPKYNYPYYNTCNALLCISKQTEMIVRGVLDEWDNSKRIIEYVPHGIDTEKFRPKGRLKAKEAKEVFKKSVKEKKHFDLLFAKKYDTIFLWNSNNQGRKRPIDAVMAYKTFCDMDPSYKENTLLLMHTQPVATDYGSTDMNTVLSEVFDGYNVVISVNKSLPFEDLPTVYRMADVAICNSDAEGFGLTCMEALMSGVPVIATATGGLQDQIPKYVRENEKYYSSNLTGQFTELATKINEEFAEHPWSELILPTASTFTGSPVTPYIYEDRTSPFELAKLLRKLHEENDVYKKNLLEYGLPWLHENFSEHVMVDGIVKGIYDALEQFTPRKDWRSYEH